MVYYTIMAWITLFFVALGHAFFWVALINQIRGVFLSRQWCRRLSTLCFVGAGLSGLLLLAPSAWQGGIVLPGGLPLPNLHTPLGVYLGLCGIMGLLVTLRWASRKARRHPQGLVQFDRSRRLRPEAGSEWAGAAHGLLARLPGNEILHLEVVERGVTLVRRPTALTRDLSIIHLSDMHITGQIGKAFFEEVVRQCNRLEADVIALTGDTLDEVDCLDWTCDILSRLKARHARCFIFGNHDRYSDPRRFRRMLIEAGWIDLGGRWLETTFGDIPVVLGGNEEPWFPPPGSPGPTPVWNPQPDGPLRIALAHTPDRLDWAQASGADVLLAGHTHGGQICVPGIGPIFTPCRFGTRYAAGLFYEAPTVMHVTRGVSAETPIRLACPPEIVHLTLCSSGVANGQQQRTQEKIRG